MKTKTKTILFVEDNQLVLTSYRNCLERDGFNVEAADDGEKALAKLPLLKPDLVILDLMLPKLNGREVLKFIRNHGELKETPVLILSNAYMDEHSLTTKNSGANKRLLKTQCTRPALLRAVRELLGMSLPADLPRGDDGRTPGDEADWALLQDVRKNLLKDAPAEIARIRDHCLAYVKAGGTQAGAGPLDNLYQRVQFLCVCSGLGECTKIAHLASALEAILFEIISKKSSPSPSALQTIAQAVDCLGRLFQSNDFNAIDSVFKAKVLIVDDDPICNLATVQAMKRAKLEAVSTLDPIAALEMARTGQYDMVLLDINMPGLNGFEVCEKLRVLAGYQTTPVIFVTACNEFQTRAQAVLSGGNDLITKPISPLELALKTIMHLVDPREQSRATRPDKEIKTPPVIAPAASSALEQIEIHAAAMLDAAEKGSIDGNKTPPPAARPRAGSGDDAQPIRLALPDTDVVLPDLLPLDRNTPEIKTPAPALFPAEIPPFHRNTQPLNDINHGLFMKNQTEPNRPFDKLATEVTRIFFGEDNPSEMTLRLTRIALERYNVPEIISRVPATNGSTNGAANGHKPAANEPFCGVAREVTRIIFGDEAVSEMHLRLTRIALERYHVPEIINDTNPLPETNRLNGSRASSNPDIVKV